MKHCLIVVEQGREQLSRELLHVAKTMYGAEAYHLTAAVMGGNEMVIQGYFHEILAIPLGNIFDTGYFARILEELYCIRSYDSILFPGTQLGRMLAPRLAMRLNAGIVADVTEVRRNGTVVEMIRPAFSGKLMAGIEKVGQGPIMMTVRPGVFSWDEPPTVETAVTTYHPKSKPSNRIQLVSRQERAPSTDIRDSDVIVSGGGGIMRDFDSLDALSQRLGGMKGASRKVVDSGSADRSIQVGQSGKVVHPKLYVAIGIYGALQHVAGLRRVKHLIAVNTDSKAPICSLADIVVNGDGAEFVRKLVARIDKER